MSIREYLVKGPLGFGGAPLGNMFRNIPDDEAEATVEEAWTQGTRFFDTAPFYGAGLSEIRMGRVLAKHERRDHGNEDQRQRVEDNRGKIGVGQQVVEVGKAGELSGRTLQIVVLKRVPDREGQRHNGPDPEQYNGRKHQRPRPNVTTTLRACVLVN